MTDRPPIGRVLVISPTYNERDNLPGLVARVRQATPDVDLLVVDDNSPDGTGEIADALAAGDPRVRVLHRSAKEGLGAAYVAGFRWGLDRGYDVLVEMDADGSHAPEELPALLAALADADVVLGSRWVPGGSIVNWPRRRAWLSKGGNAYARMMLGVPIRDATGGYRAYRSDVFDRLDLAGVASHGYCFQVDLAWRAWLAGLTVTEVPIRFTERVAGTSKMSRAIVAEALWRVTLWGVRSRRSRAGRLKRASERNPRPQVEAE